MAQQADITVKMADGTTNVTYSAVTPSSGDKTSAVWMDQSNGTAIAFHPRVDLSSRDNGAKTGRRLDSNFVYPQTATDSTTSLTTVVNKCIITLSAIVPSEMPGTVVAEAVSQGVNIFASSAFKAALETGYAPT